MRPRQHLLPDPTRMVSLTIKLPQVKSKVSSPCQKRDRITRNHHSYCAGLAGVFMVVRKSPFLVVD